MNNNSNNIITEQAVDKNSNTQSVDSHRSREEQTVQQLHFLLHLDRLIDLRAKINEHAVEIEDRKNRVHRLTETMQAINNLMDDKGGLDMTKALKNDQDPKHEQCVRLQSMLKALKEDLGIDIVADQVKYSPRETANLLENLKYSQTEYETEMNIEMKKLEHVYNEMMHSWGFTKSAISRIDQALRAIIQNLK